MDVLYKVLLFKFRHHLCKGSMLEPFGINFHKKCLFMLQYLSGYKQGLALGNWSVKVCLDR